MKKLFESRKVRASGSALPTPDVKIIFTKAPFVQYQQILLDKNFRMGAQKTPMQKNIRNKCWSGHL